MSRQINAIFDENGYPTEINGTPHPKCSITLACELIDHALATFEEADCQCADCVAGLELSRRLAKTIDIAIAEIQSQLETKQ